MSAFGGKDGSAYPAQPAYPMAAYPADTTEALPTTTKYDGMVGTADTAVRLGFLRKVYALLTLCFGVTVGISCAFSLVVPVRQFIVENRWILWTGWAVGLVSYLALVCTRPKKPLDAVLLSFFVLGFSFMIGTICATYFENNWGRVVLNAFISTAAIFITLTAYVLITKKDFSFLSGFLIGATIGLIVGTLLVFFIGFATGRFNRWVYFGISIFGALLFTGYILYDTSLILHKYGPDDWVMAVASLYIDVTQLFLYLLTIFSALEG